MTHAVVRLMTDFIVDLIAAGGYLGIVVLMVIENVFPPIPSEVIMGLGGMPVARGQMEFWPLMLAGTRRHDRSATMSGTGSADSWGYQRLAPLVDRHGRWLTIEWQRRRARARASSGGTASGSSSCSASRRSCRTIISLPAGLTHMTRWHFLLWTAAGAAIWNALLVAAPAMCLGAQFRGDRSLRRGRRRVVVLVAIALAYIWRVASPGRPRRRERLSSALARMSVPIDVEQRARHRPRYRSASS